MGQAKGSDGAMAKIVACQTNGIWAPVPSDKNLDDALSTFSDYYATGLGHAPDGSPQRAYTYGTHTTCTRHCGTVAEFIAPPSPPKKVAQAFRA